MTDSAPPASTDTWESILESLRRRFPGQKDSVLYCVHKLQFNPEGTLRDFAPEARMHGIPVAGRALHSARLLLGLIREGRAAAKPVADTDPPLLRRRQRAPEADDGGASIETKVLSAVRQIQSAAGAEAEQLRTAIRQAIAILQRAIGS